MAEFSIQEGLREYLATIIGKGDRKVLSRELGVDPNGELSVEDFIESCIVAAKGYTCK